MHHITATFKQIGLLTTALTLALVANFAYGQWADPTAAPPGNNATAPINIGGDYQVKAGNLGAVDLLAGDRMRSDQYCNLAGTTCASIEELIGASSPPSLVVSLEGPFETYGSIVNANNSCRSAGYDGVWAGMDNDDGSEFMYCYESLDSSLVIQQAGRFETDGSIVNANNSCRSAGYDGVWAGMDNDDGSEFVYCYSDPNSVFTVQQAGRFETDGSIVNANNSCRSAGYDGVWAGMDNDDGSEFVYCYNSNI